MNLQELLTKLETPIVIRPTRRMAQGELEIYLDKAADILRGKSDYSEFRGYDCIGTLSTPKLVNCLQPDRRVEVEVRGTR